MKTKTPAKKPAAQAGRVKRHRVCRDGKRLMVEHKLTPDQIKLCQTFEDVVLCERGDAVRLVLGEMPAIIHRMGMAAETFDPVKSFDQLRRCTQRWERAVLIQWLTEKLPDGLVLLDPPPTPKEVKYLRETKWVNHQLIRSIILATVMALLRCLPVPGVPMSSAAYGRDHACLQ